MKRVLANVKIEYKPAFSRTWRNELVSRNCKVLEEKNEIIRVSFEVGFGFSDTIERWISKNDIVGVIE